MLPDAAPGKSGLHARGEGERAHCSDVLAGQAVSNPQRGQPATSRALEVMGALSPAERLKRALPQLQPGAPEGSGCPELP